MGDGVGRAADEGGGMGSKGEDAQRGGLTRTSSYDDEKNYDC
jgi:hypothetical protein